MYCPFYLVVNAQGCNEGCWLLRRPSHRLHAAVNVTTKVAGCYEGCQASTKVECYCEGCNRGCWLLRRLPHRLQRSLLALAEAAILLRRLKQSLSAAMKDAT
ncbi:hypothetical protein Tco_1579332 [Tanacetum coccineum]